MYRFLLPVGPTSSRAPFRTRRVGRRRVEELDCRPSVEPMLMRPSARVMPLLRISSPVVSSPSAVRPLPDREVDVHAGEDVRDGRVVGRVDHHRAVGDGERRVALRGRAVGREVRVAAVDAVSERRRAAAEGERLGEGECSLAVLDEAAGRLLDVAGHDEVVVDLPHDGGGIDGGLEGDGRRPGTARRTGVAERAARLRERPRAQLMRPAQLRGLGDHERPRTERRATGMVVVGVEAHGSARRARVHRKRVAPCHERLRVCLGTRRRIHRHRLRHRAHAGTQ